MTVKKRIEEFEKNLAYKEHIDNAAFQRGHMLDRMNFHKVPAVSVAAIDDYEIQWAKGYGTLSRESDIKVNEDTLFQAASMSKPVFAVAVMRLVEQGILDLDEDVNTYLTSWKVPANGSWQPRITLRQLLSHTAGVTVSGFAGYNVDADKPTVIEILDGKGSSNSDPIRVNLIPGTKFRYSGGGYTIAQQAVVDVLNKSFPEIMKEMVLEPMGMEKSVFAQPLPDSLKEQVPKGYGWHDAEVNGGHHVYPEMAAAGLWTTATDMAKFGITMQKILNGKADGILKKISLEEMLKLQAGSDDMGLGFKLEGENNDLRFGHTGCNVGFGCQMIFYNDGGKGAVVMINSEGFAVIQESMYGLADVYDWEGFVPQVEERETNLEMKVYAGTYISDHAMNIKIQNKGDQLYMSLENQSPIELVPMDRNKFKSLQVNAEVEFCFDGKSITALNIYQEGAKIPYRKHKVVSFKQPIGR